MALKPKTYGDARSTANVKAYDRARIEDRAFYWSTPWRKLRKAFLAAHPVCEWCQREIATQVDHRVPRVQLTPEQALSWEYCRAGCASCHAKYGAKRNRAERQRQA